MAETPSSTAKSPLCVAPRRGRRPARARLGRGLALSLALAGLTLAARPARGELLDERDKLVRGLRDKGLDVTVGPPTFAEAGRPRAVRLEAALLAPAAAPAGCTTLVLLAERTGELTVATLGPTGPSGEPIKSAQGVALVGRCGAERAALGRLLVELASGRGAVDALVVRGKAVLTDVTDVLPERARGPVAARADAGAPFEPGPLPERVSRAERRAKQDGAGAVARVAMQAGAVGNGELTLKLADGCHRVELLAEVPTFVPRRVTDVDAEVVDASGQVLARDRGDAPDARLDFCVGERASVVISFTGAAGPVSVVAVTSRWALPKGIPEWWGARARAGVAAIVKQRHLPELASPPVFESLGAQGDVRVSVPVVPGRCYFASVAMVQGDARYLRLSVEGLFARAPRDESGQRPESLGVAFCAEVEDRVGLVVDARGPGPWWALGVWDLS